MTSLTVRKQLLLAESEINREQLVRDCRTLTDEVRELRERLHTVCSAVTSAASVGMAGVKVIGEVRGACSREKGSWLSALLTGMRAGTSLWKSFRSRRS
jgi:hypothetical protein